MVKEAFFTEARRGFHAALLKSILRTDSNGVPSNADKDSKPSVSIARGIIERLGSEAKGARLAAQMSGSKFEEVCSEFLKETFDCLGHIRPGKWEIGKGLGSGLSEERAKEMAKVIADVFKRYFERNGY